MSAFTTRLTRSQDLWALKVTTPAGEKLTYRYGSESEARYFAAIFQLGPTFVPEPPPLPAAAPPRVKKKIKLKVKLKKRAAPARAAAPRGRLARVARRSAHAHS